MMKMKKIVTILLLIVLLLFKLNSIAYCEHIIDESLEKFEFELFIKDVESFTFSQTTIYLDNDESLLKFKSGEYVLSEKTGRFEKETKKEWTRKISKEKVIQFINILNYINFLSMPDSFSNAHWEAVADISHIYTLTYVKNDVQKNKKVVALGMGYFLDFKNDNVMKAHFLSTFLLNLDYFRSDDGTLLFWEDNK